MPTVCKLMPTFPRLRLRSADTTKKFNHGLVRSLQNAPFRMLAQRSGTCYQMIYVEHQR